MRTLFKCYVWATTLIWFLLVFFFSAETAIQSSLRSDAVVEEVLEAVTDYAEWPEEVRQATLQRVSTTARKTAHFLLYMAGGFFLSLSCWFFREKTRCCVPAFLIGVLYAVSDELHQRFVPGRACELHDLLIDSSGVLIGCLLAFLFLWILRRTGVTERDAS